MTRHKHADLIHAYADGAEIESWNGQRWVVDKAPCFLPELDYRIKPRGVKREGWINIIKNDAEAFPQVFIYATKYAAQSVKPINCVDTVKIEWEESE